MSGILGLHLTFVHLLMLEFRTVFLKGWGGESGPPPPPPPSNLNGSCTLLMANGGRGVEQCRSRPLRVVIILSPGAMNSISLQSVWEECNPVLETQST